MESISSPEKQMRYLNSFFHDKTSIFRYIFRENILRKIVNNYQSACWICDQLSYDGNVKYQVSPLILDNPCIEQLYGTAVYKVWFPATAGVWGTYTRFSTRNRFLSLFPGSEDRLKVYGGVEKITDRQRGYIGHEISGTSIFLPRNVRL